MTPRGKIVLTALIILVVGFGIWRWWDKIAPGGESGTRSVDPSKFKEEQGKGPTLLAGDKPVSLIGESAIPPVTGVSDYKKETKNGKLVVQFPINIWPGWAPILVANGGMEASVALPASPPLGSTFRLAPSATQALPFQCLT